MRTWFCKDTQRWVSEIPRAFWLGIYDYKTGEKLYSDDTIYSANPFLRSLNKDLYINVLKAISREKYGEEHVWSSDWNVLTTTMLVESYPNVRKMYKPSHIGKVFLIGILFDESGEIKL